MTWENLFKWATFSSGDAEVGAIFMPKKALIHIIIGQATLIPWLNIVCGKLMLITSAHIETPCQACMEKRKRNQPVTF